LSSALFWCFSGSRTQALRVPEEKIYIRLEDVIVITEKGADILTTFVPMEIAEIEKLMREEGMLQRYPKDLKTDLEK
jgi:Xaa-Pro aminopeptidase